MSAQRWSLIVPGVVLVLGAATLSTSSIPPSPTRPADAARFPSGWEQVSQRQEILPDFSFDPTGGPKGGGAFVITAADSVGQHGWCQKTFPVGGGRFYRFQAVRRTHRVGVPRRSAVVRIVWQDAAGKAVRADVPPGREKEPGPLPLAEPEHPLDGETDRLGWTRVAGLYRAPSRASRAVVELHLQWAPRGRVEWSDVTFEQAPAPPPRKVRLATIHHVPSGKSPKANCQEYAPLIAAAARQKADLVVLGETVPYVGVGKKPHETAEAIPGPTTDYFGGLARRHRLHVVVSLYERDGKVVYNACVLLGPDGKLIGKYRKVCLPHSEIEAGVAPGSDFPVFDTKLGKVGLMVCYDGFFPEVARELTNRGAEVIAWPVWGCNPLLARARACENHVYLVSSTYTDPKANWMISAVFDHAGQPIATAEKEGSVAVAEVDLSQRHFWRNNLGDFRSLAQRHRPEPAPTPGATSPAVSGKENAEKPKKGMKTVAVLLFEGVELLDFTGPAEVFIVADEGKAFRVVTVAESTRPVKTMGGITVTPDFPYQTAPKADVLIVPGGNTRAVGKAGRAWLKKASGQAEITLSVCFGAFLLADVGLLDGVEATTHSWGIEGLKKAAPRCKVVKGRRFVDSGKVVTTAGVTAGIDGALQVVERLLGKEAARWTAEEWMEYRRESGPKK